MKLAFQPLLGLVVLKPELARLKNQLVEVLNLVIQLGALRFEPPQAVTSCVEILAEALLALPRNLGCRTLANQLSFTAGFFGLALLNPEALDLLAGLVALFLSSS